MQSQEKVLTKITKKKRQLVPFVKTEETNLVFIVSMPIFAQQKKRK